MLFILYFASDPESESESESESEPESESVSIRSPESEPEPESEQVHHDSATLLPMSTYLFTFVPKYIDGNRIPTDGIDIESIPATSIIAEAKWARLAWQRPSALGEGERVRSG